MWQDIERERKSISKQEQRLRQREDAIRECEYQLFRNSDQQPASAEQDSATERPAPLPMPVPRSCFAPTSIQQRYEQELRAYRESLVLKSVKAQAAPRQKRNRAKHSRLSATHAIPTSHALLSITHVIPTPHTSSRPKPLTENVSGAVERSLYFP